MQADEIVIDDPAVAETLFDPLRYRLFRALEPPRSVPELSEELGVAANRLYYHVRRLLRAGLIQQVDARAVGKHTERVYGIAAKKITFAKDLQLPRLVESKVGGVLNEVFAEASAALQAAQARTDDPPALFSWLIGQLTRERAAEFERRFQSLLDEFADASEEGEPYGILAALTPLPR